jgi:2-polyprenyl-6-methoxyphenol hydroxylase-like FAD-dependent oxidoreductase
MKNAEVAIIGAGLAGATAAAMLTRAGVDVAVIDPREVYPPDFRCEKLDAQQIGVLEKTGLAKSVLRSTTPSSRLWIARLGRIVDKRPNAQAHFLYDTFVNAMRAEIPRETPIVHDKASDITLSDDRQTVALASGEQISARLVVVANGLNIGLQHKLGMKREVISKCHSISIGFDIKPADRKTFGFNALTYYGETPADRVAYLSIFPIEANMRVNLFVYRKFDDPWLRALREAPEATLLAALPGLKKALGEFAVLGHIHIRPIDLYVTQVHQKPGVVLVGDAFSSSCPAAGTGALKVLTDVERLCNVHIPRWLATPGMGLDKIAAFYADPVKRECDAFSRAKAYALRSVTIEPGARWQAKRYLKYWLHTAIGTMRKFKGTDAPAPLLPFGATGRVLERAHAPRKTG